MGRGGAARAAPAVSAGKGAWECGHDGPQPIRKFLGCKNMAQGRDTLSVEAHTRYLVILASMSALVLQTAGCTNGSTARGSAQRDSTEVAAREVRRKAFLAEQQAQTDSSLRAARRDRPFMVELVVQGATLVAFFPPAEMANDSVALRHRLRTYQEVAESSGWTFEQRYSEDLRITDRRSNALYLAPLPSGSTGVVLIAPGARPQVWFGNLRQSTLREGLRAYLDALRGKGGAAALGT